MSVMYSVKFNGVELGNYIVKIHIQSFQIPLV